MPAMNKPPAAKRAESEVLKRVTPRNAAGRPTAKYLQSLIKNVEYPGVSQTQGKSFRVAIRITFTAHRSPQRGAVRLWVLAALSTP
jgi:hypothetical protein